MGLFTAVLAVEAVLWARLMRVSLIITPARALLNDKTGGRWSDDTLMSFLTMTARELMRDVKWPPARLTTWTIPGNQEYQIPDELIRVYSVYLQGQLCTETTIQTLEGHQIQRYDQHGFGSAPLTGGGGPPGNAGNYVPQWTVQPPMSYPVANQWGYPRPDAEGWSMGQPPRYYLRGGYIGFVPIPANGPGYDNLGNPIPNICDRLRDSAAAGIGTGPAVVLPGSLLRGAHLGRGGEGQVLGRYLIHERESDVCA